LDEIRYLSVKDVVNLLDDVLARDNESSPTCRDASALESAINRCRQLAHYEEADLFRQAVSLAEGVALSHTFIDGNKRAALAAIQSFLYINARLVIQDPMKAAYFIEAIIIAERGPARTAKSAEFEDWLRVNCRKPLGPPVLRLVYY
jgi:death-on-curing protein